jgi:hypothetical protein
MNLRHFLCIKCRQLGCGATGICMIDLKLRTKKEKCERKVKGRREEHAKTALPAGTTTKQEAPFIILLLSNTLSWCHSYSHICVYFVNLSIDCILTGGGWREWRGAAIICIHSDDTVPLYEKTEEQIQLHILSTKVFKSRC